MTTTIPTTTITTPPNAQKLTPQLLTQFVVGKKFNSTGCINSLDFSSKGDSLILATDEPDEALHLCQVATATVKKSVFCRKSGCELVRFTHQPNCVLVASKNKGWDDSIRYLSLHDNRYLRYFKGHRDLVTSLSMSPLDDSFLSASLDHTMRVWDLRTNVCQGLMNLPEIQSKQTIMSSGKVLVSHDPAGMVFAVACSPNIIKLFDSRSYDQGPFVTFDIPVPRIPSFNNSSSASSAASSFFTWSSLKFSPDGKDLLLTTTESCEWPGSKESTANQNYTNQILLIDSYEGTIKQTYLGHEFNPNNSTSTPASSSTAVTSSPASSTSAAFSYAHLPFEASFSPDGEYVFAGSRAGNVHSWYTGSGEPVAIWNGLNTTAPLTTVQFCPTKMTLVSGDATGQLLWWIPQAGATATTATTSATTANHGLMNGNHTTNGPAPMNLTQ